MLYALVAHLIEIAFWAVLFVICGEFSDFRTAYYHSAVNYTSLGYGDIIMSPAWRLLGPLETADGMLLFGVSTAMIFAVIQRLAEARFADLQDWVTSSAEGQVSLPADPTQARKADGADDHHRRGSDTGTNQDRSQPPEPGQGAHQIQRVVGIKAPSP
jgi:hypothetical protein